MVCEAFGGGVFTYVTQLCNDIADYFEVFLAYQPLKMICGILIILFHLREVHEFTNINLEVCPSEVIELTVLLNMNFANERIEPV